MTAIDVYRAGPTPGDSPRISVVLPTFQRRDLVLEAVRFLERQDFDEPFEVVVAVDGSTDGTWEALRGLTPTIPFTAVRQPNAGASAARNLGARYARGSILLFLDDDMTADPDLLAQHDRCHLSGADAVLGHMPLHPGSVHTAISAAVGGWAEGRLARLLEPGAELTLHDMLTGQLSVSARVFASLGGFDLAFTRGGSFGNEDVDFGHRLLEGGYDVRFNPRAISHQRYVVTARQHLRQWRQAGRADVVFARKYPAQASVLFELNGIRGRFARLVARPLSRAPLWSLITAPVRATGARIGDRPGRFPWYVFIHARTLEYWRGVAEAGGIPSRRRGAVLRVLSYHAITDLRGRGVLEPYGVPLEQLRRQLATLRAHGCHPITVAELVAFAEGRGGLPRRAVLFTFDDGYDDLPEAIALLHAEGVEAVVFAVSGLLGGENAWDRFHGGSPLRLLDADGLHRLRNHGVEIGGHSRTHPVLPTLSAAEVEAEIQGCVDDLDSLGLGPVRLYAYPYGESDSRARETARRAGLIAFGVRPGVMDAGTDHQLIPRLEIVRTDDGIRFLAKVLFARELGWALPLAGVVHLFVRRVTSGVSRRMRPRRGQSEFAAGVASVP